MAKRSAALVRATQALAGARMRATDNRKKGKNEQKGWKRYDTNERSGGFV